MKHIFREYDIRGITSTQITPKFAHALGIVLGKIMLQKGTKSVSVGYDARLSGKQLHDALICGLGTHDIKIVSLGLVPTPLGYFSNYALGIDASIIITASHNPKQYNGFKITINKESFFGDELASIYDDVMAAISDEISSMPQYDVCDVVSEYVAFMKKHFYTLRGFDVPVCIDLAGGAACQVAKRVLDELGIAYAAYFGEFDGEFSSHEPDPTNEQNLYALKYELGFDGFVPSAQQQARLTPTYHNGYAPKSAQIGFGFDGDADRIVCVLKDKIIKGDELCYLFAASMCSPKILCEVKCSKVIYDEINQIGRCYMGKTGHSNIKKSIKELGVSLAAELSGHVFFNDRYYGYDDAIYAMLRVLEIYHRLDFARVLARLPRSYASDEIKIPVEESAKFDIINEFLSLVKDQNLNAKITQIDGVRLDFDDGFALLRASNTSPYLVARFESTDKNNALKYQSIISNTLSKLNIAYPTTNEI